MTFGWVVAAVLAIALLALATAFFVGRLAERQAIVDWLWENSGTKSWVGLVVDVEEGAHRRF